MNTLQVKTRDVTIVPFVRERIVTAVRKAAAALLEERGPDIPPGAGQGLSGAVATDAAGKPNLHGLTSRVTSLPENVLTGDMMPS